MSGLTCSLQPLPGRVVLCSFVADVIISSFIFLQVTEFVVSRCTLCFFFFVLYIRLNLQDWLWVYVCMNACWCEYVCFLFLYTRELFLTLAHRTVYRHWMKLDYFRRACRLHCKWRFFFRNFKTFKICWKYLHIIVEFVPFFWYRMFTQRHIMTTSCGACRQKK